jgi:hypothetical protein
MIIEGKELIAPIKNLLIKYEGTSIIPVHVTDEYIIVGTRGGKAYTDISVADAEKLFQAGLELNTSIRAWVIPRIKLIN